MKRIKTFKLFESSETVEFLIGDLYGVNDPHFLKDALTSLFDELDDFNFEIRYNIQCLFSLNKEWRHLVRTEGFEWDYNLFIDDEKGLHKVDYDMWEGFRSSNNIPYDLFGASISVICYTNLLDKNWDELYKVVDFINDGLKSFDLGNIQVDRKSSGFLSPDFGSTGYLLSLEVR